MSVNAGRCCASWVISIYGGDSALARSHRRQVWVGLRATLRLCHCQIEFHKVVDTGMESLERWNDVGVLAIDAIACLGLVCGA